ncbi:MAG: hypothetical protein K6G30_15665 [Acetatifactor sp.]|nr:hypothetical protein [Acetatifactor sp.]
MNEIVSFEDLYICFREMWRKKYMIVVAGVVGAIVGAIMSIGVKADEYQAVTTVYGSSYNSFVESDAVRGAVLDYATVVRSSSVVRRALNSINKLDLSVKDALEMFTVDYNSEDSPIVTITVTGNDKQFVGNFANALASSFIVEMQNITGLGKATVLDEAEAEVSSSEIKQIAIQIIVFSFAFAALTGLVVFLYEFFQKKIRTVTQMEEMAGIKIIGVIPMDVK